MVVIIDTTMEVLVMENITFKQKMIDFVKRYGYYMFLGFMAISVIMTLIIVGLTDRNSDKNSLPTNSAITPYMPVLNATLYKEYYGDELVYNATLKQWETHNGIDLQVANGSKVYSILDGKVVDVYSNILEGTVVVVEHADGLTSCYGSLDNGVQVEIGDKVSRGDELGSVSSSANSEIDAGAHLHFSMMDDGQKIDLAAYLNISTK
jgi:murein DD-endopeptidase MepM/ murein hydrolase activator NlpD